MNNALKKAPISVLIGLLAVVILVISIFTTLNSSFLNMPVFPMVLGEDAVEEAQETFDKYINDAEELLEQADEDEMEEFEEETGLAPKKYVKLMKNPTLNTLISVGNDLAEADADYNVSEEDIEVFGLFRTIIIVWAIVVILFALLGTLLKKKALTIIGMVLSILYFVLFAGFLLLVIYFALSIASIVMLSKEKKAATAVIE